MHRVARLANYVLTALLLVSAVRAPALIGQAAIGPGPSMLRAPTPLAERVTPGLLGERARHGLVGAVAGGVVGLVIWLGPCDGSRSDAAIIPLGILAGWAVGRWLWPARDSAESGA